jgi:hypothetical protein
VPSEASAAYGEATKLQAALEVFVAVSGQTPSGQPAAIHRSSATWFGPNGSREFTHRLYRPGVIQKQEDGTYLARGLVAGPISEESAYEIR